MIILAGFFLAGQALAVKPGNTTNPNGFPSGSHFNLNLIGKKDAFICPDEVDYLTTDQNVIYIPDNGEEIKIYIESGKGKDFAAINQLTVTDWCAFDNGGGSLQLPKNDDGYGVYVRLLAKHNHDPETDPYIDNILASLSFAEDELGNQLVYLGEVDEGYVQTFDGKIYRHKGKSKAVEISDLFKFSGTICTISTDSLDDLPNLCCFDTDEDGRYNYCNSFDQAAEDASCSGDTTFGECNDYDSDWIFNLFELVNYLWQFDNNGVKLIQIRFYPR
jgi:hypothetical protein